MMKFSGLFQAAVFVAFIGAPRVSLAVETRVWEQSDQAEFERGKTQKLSLRSDGHVMLAPAFKELATTGIPYLWAATEDAKGTLYYAGGAPTGATAKIFAMPPKGPSKVFAEIAGLEVHSLVTDGQGRLYAAVLPDAKIYRISTAGKPELFFDPKCKYVWAMQFDAAGNLYVATGDSGLIYKVTPDGKGTEFFRTEETHARSMTIDHQGNLIVGTEPSGLVLRITPSGESFVLYQTNKREVTAVAERNGLIYAAAVGSKAAAAVVSGPAPVLPPATVPAATTATPGTIKVTPNVPVAAPAIGSLSASVTGGSEFYRIQKDGFAEKIWGSPTELIYAVAFDAQGKPLLGTGNRGLIYRVDSDELSTQLLNSPPTQVTGLLQGRNDVVYAVTGNVGNVYSIGPAFEKSGTLESEVLDVGSFARWGKAHINPSAKHAGTFALETRSGNVNRPQKNWSEWSKVAMAGRSGQIESPAARFLQYRLTLSAEGSGPAPELNSIDIAYLPKNIAPKVNQIDISPFNYREAASNSSLDRSVQPSGSPSTLTLPPVGQRKNPSSSISLESNGAATLQYSKGFVTVRWTASDENGDALQFKVEVRGREDMVWRVLKENLLDRFFAFDATAFPDGEYVVRISATDALSNSPADALTASLESDPFTIDNTPPELLDAHTGKDGANREITFTAKDALSWIDKAEYSVDGREWILMNPVNGVTDSQTLKYRVTAKAQQLVTVRVFDEDDNVAVRQFPPE